MKNLYNIMSAVSFAGVLFIMAMLVYVNVTRGAREERNKQYIDGLVEKAVLERIVEMIPSTTGKVAQ
tara:strand:- start:97 stop:297 length:201 start_codon:yes stop_codon:yes gene_type:complete